jgi:hypothetical protein
MLDRRTAGELANELARFAYGQSAKIMVNAPVLKDKD